MASERSTARAANCRAHRRTQVLTASKSRWSTAPGATRRAISASNAGANSCWQAFLRGGQHLAGGALGFQFRLAGLVADLDQLGDQAAQALALGDPCTGGVEPVRRDRAGPRLDIDGVCQDPARAVFGMVGGGAAAVGFASIAVGLDEGAGLPRAHLEPPGKCVIFNVQKYAIFDAH